jgi:hypothetical protein
LLLPLLSYIYVTNCKLLPISALLYTYVFIVTYVHPVAGPGEKFLLLPLLSYIYVTNCKLLPISALLCTYVFIVTYVHPVGIRTYGQGSIRISMLYLKMFTLSHEKTFV